MNSRLIEEPMCFGHYIRNARIEAGLSLRSLADKIGVSHVFLGEVERGVKAVLPEKRWKSLIKVLPKLKRKDLEAWDEQSYCQSCYRRLPMEFRV